MRRTLLLAAASTLGLTLATSASAQLLQHKDLSLSVALAIANGALDACKAMGYPASVVVVDRAGDTLCRFGATAPVRTRSRMHGARPTPRIPSR